MTAQVKPFRFEKEKDLESYLEAHLSLTGQDLLTIGRQVNWRRGITDLFAIDVTGVIYIIELKLGKASDSVIAQVLRYRHKIKRLHRERVAGAVAASRLNVDLADAFQRHFGHPLPGTVNESQVVMIIAASVDSKTAEAILELLDEGYPITTFRYVVQSDAVSLIACCRTDKDVEKGSHLEERPPAAPNPVPALPTRSKTRRVDGNIRRFWSTHAEKFMPFVTFRFIYERYEDWVHEEEANDVRLCQRGLFGQHLSAITAESGEWIRVFVPHGDDYVSYNTVKVPSAARTYRAFRHDAAYQRNQIDGAKPRRHGETPGPASSSE